MIRSCSTGSSAPGHFRGAVEVAIDLVVEVEGPAVDPTINATTGDSSIKLQDGGTTNRTISNPDGTDDLVFTGLGNVGIGTATPAAKLQVKGGMADKQSPSSLYPLLLTGGGGVRCLRLVQD